MFWILQISEDEEQEQVDEQGRQVEFEKEGQQMKKERAKALEQQAQRAHEREIAPNPSITVGLAKKGEMLASGCGTLLGSIPWIGIIFRILFWLVKAIIKMIRIPLEMATRFAAKREETTALKEAKQLRKETRTKPQTESAHGGEGVRLPILGGLQGDNKPKEVLGGFLRFSPQLYRFLFIMGIGLFVMAAILVAAASIAYLCKEPSVMNWLIRYRSGLDCNF